MRKGRERPDLRTRSGKAVKGWFGAAEAIDQFAKGNRADVVGANETQTGEPLTVIERGLRNGRGGET